MIRICFVCLGNICRSPMAEYMMKEKVRKLNLKENFYITSRATSYEEQGNEMHIGTKTKLQEHNIPYTNHQATRLEKDDYNKYDYFICMDNSNINNTKIIFGGDPNNKIFRLLDITNIKRDVLDPWYTGNFKVTYDDLCIGIDKLIKEIDFVELVNIEDYDEETVDICA